MKKVYINGAGLFTPQESISNEELVKAFNNHVDLWNKTNEQAISNGDIKPKEYSSEAFIEKSSGIKARYVLNKEGILDPTQLKPAFPKRNDDELSYQAEIGLAAANEALDLAQISADQIDQIIVSCSNYQRPYPAIAIEIQAALGVKGSAYDMNVACSSATFAIQNAYSTIAAGLAKHILIINPEICSGHLDHSDRDCHFIFGDAATALVISSIPNDQSFEIQSIKLQTSFSNNIRNNSGFLDRFEPNAQDQRDKLFCQQGRKVFKEVLPLVTEHILSQIEAEHLKPSRIKRLWLHQANQTMNEYIAKKIYDRPVTPEEAPIILDRYANTAGAGSIIAFKLYAQDFESGDLGIISSFGAGYSVGSIIVKKV